MLPRSTAKDHIPSTSAMPGEVTSTTAADAAADS
jgi:hypothetical protein